MSEIILDKIELYGTLDVFQFVESQRLYFCKDVKIIDITSFQERLLNDILICVYDDQNKAELFIAAQEYLNDKKTVLFGKIEKVSNKREKHETCCTEGIIFIDSIKYVFQKAFIRVQLTKIGPPRLIIEY